MILQTCRIQGCCSYFGCKSTSTCKLLLLLQFLLDSSVSLLPPSFLFSHPSPHNTHFSHSLPQNEEWERMFGDQTPPSKPPQQPQQPSQSLKPSPELVEKIPKKLGQDAATYPSSATQSPLLLPKTIGTGKCPQLAVLFPGRVQWVWSE